MKASKRTDIYLNHLYVLYSQISIQKIFFFELFPLFGSKIYSELLYDLCTDTWLCEYSSLSPQEYQAKASQFNFAINAFLFLRMNLSEFVMELQGYSSFTQTKALKVVCFQCVISPFLLLSLSVMWTFVWCVPQNPSKFVLYFVIIVHAVTVSQYIESLCSMQNKNVLPLFSKQTLSAFWCFIKTKPSHHWVILLVIFHNIDLWITWTVYIIYYCFGVSKCISKIQTHL